MREIIPTPPSSDPPLIVKTRQGCGFSARWLGTGVAGFIDVSGLLELERQKGAPRIYWHRELPPYDAQPMGEHIVEATSSPVPDTIARRDELWNRCRDDLMAKARERLTEEMVRLGGRYAHVLDESIETRHNPSTGEAWLARRFTYMLYR